MVYRDIRRLYFIAALGLLATAFAIPLLRFIPKSALSAVIICSVLPTVDFRILGHMWRTRKSDLVAYSTTFLACFLLGLEYGILVGVMVSICVLLFPVARPIVSVYFAKRDIIFTPHGSTDFPAMRYLHELVMEHIEQRKNKPGRIIIDGSHWTDVDFTVIANMTDFISEVKNEGWQIVFHEMNEIISGGCIIVHTRLSSVLRNSCDNRRFVGRPNLFVWPQS